MSTPLPAAISLATPTFTPFQPALDSEVAPTQEPLPTEVISTTQEVPPPQPAGASFWVDPHLPAALREAAALPPGFTAASQSEGATLRLEPGAHAPVSQWVFALVAPFATIEQGVSFEELRTTWAGQPTGPLTGRPLLVDESTLGMLSSLWGEPAPGVVDVLPAEELLTEAWRGTHKWGIIPFEALEPRWKVLEVDGQSPLRKDFDPTLYPLIIPISLVTGSGQPVHAPTSWLPASNRDPSRLTTLAMTGVTALVRATAFTMEQRGVKYPGRDVGDILRQADITHISNEVPFAQDCPYPNPVQQELRFCSKPGYIDLLEDVGADVIELTGDHFQDWGNKAMFYTLDLYKKEGWPYYGGGANREEARQPLLIEHNGNRLAFIGCNAKGGGFAQAGPNHPGAVVCDYDWMHSEIARLREAGYLPIVTFQHFEYYTYKAQPNQVRDFQGMARAGALIVSGSQAHQPQALDFVDGALIHYGLGNLFFDQYDVSEATREGFIDRHVFYNGRYISSELIPIVFVDYARPRPMTPAERADLLRTVFKSSGW